MSPANAAARAAPRKPYPLRGGSFNNPGGGLTCRNSFAFADDNFFFPNAGFRCCK